MSTAPKAHVDQLKIDIDSIDESIKLQTQKKKEQFELEGENWESKLASHEQMKA